jgi:hypothetical protein
MIPKKILKKGLNFIIPMRFWSVPGQEKFHAHTLVLAHV